MCIGACHAWEVSFMLASSVSHVLLRVVAALLCREARDSPTFMRSGRSSPLACPPGFSTSTSPELPSSLSCQQDGYASFVCRKNTALVQA